MRVGIYCRLSEEDRDKINPQNDSMSIQNQKSMLIRHAVEHGWDIIDIYSDDDYAGSDRNRPEFNRLIQDAKKGRIDIVLCKTQSRFSRELEIVEKYIHGLFIEWNVRFIGLVDNADTAIKGNKKSRQINGLVNEWYLEDLSDNIRAVLDDKRSKGKFVGAFAPYGYTKSINEKGKLVIDETAAIVVRRIFALRAEGMGYTKIVRLLTEDGIPCPTLYKAQNGLNVLSKSRANMRPVWTTSMIARLLSNRVYIGDMVQGKQRKPSYKSKVRKYTKPESWIEVEATHDAIIDRETWDIVQETSGKKTTRTGTVNLLTGKVFCKNCGWALHINQSHGKLYYRCCQRIVDKNRCTGSSIPMRLLEKHVLNELNSLVKQYYDESLIMNGIVLRNPFETQIATLTAEKRKAEAKIEHLANTNYTLFLDRANGVVQESNYILLSKKLAEELDSIKKTKLSIERELDTLTLRSKQAVSKVEIIKKYTHFDQLSRDLVLQFIDRIEIKARELQSNCTRVDIHWNI